MSAVKLSATDPREWVRLTLKDDWGRQYFALPDGSEAQWYPLEKTGIDVRWSDGAVEHVAIKGRSYPGGTLPVIVQIKDYVVWETLLHYVDVRLSDWVHTERPRRLLQGRRNVG